MKKPLYPLQQILEVKKRRVEEAEKVLKEKKELLEKEEKKLKEAEEARDKVKKHKNEKLTQLRELLDTGGFSPKIQQMKVYLKIVDEKLVVEEKKVKTQEEQVKTAEKNVELAKENLKLKRNEVDKIVMHQGDWEKEVKKEYEILEGREQDELGAVIHSSNQRKNKE